MLQLTLLFCCLLGGQMLFSMPEQAPAQDTPQIQQERISSANDFLVDLFAEQHEDNPCLPLDLPSESEESETENDEKQGGEDELNLHLLHLYRSDSLLLKSSFTYQLNSTSLQATVPLYVLFHAWKNFLI